MCGPRYIHGPQQGRGAGERVGKRRERRTGRERQGGQERGREGESEVERERGREGGRSPQVRHTKHTGARVVVLLMAAAAAVAALGDARRRPAGGSPCTPVLPLAPGGPATPTGPSCPACPLSPRGPRGPGYPCRPRRVRRRLASARTGDGVESRSEGGLRALPRSDSGLEARRGDVQGRRPLGSISAASGIFVLFELRRRFVTLRRRRLTSWSDSRGPFTCAQREYQEIDFAASTHTTAHLRSDGPLRPLRAGRAAGPLRPGGAGQAGDPLHALPERSCQRLCSCRDVASVCDA